MEEQLLAALWLAALLGPGSDRAGQILNRFGTPEEAYEQRFTAEFQGMLTSHQAKRLRELNAESQLPMLDKAADKGIQVIPWGHPDYPRAFGVMKDPPVVLFVTGNPAVLNASALVGMVGSRRPSTYGVRVCTEMGGQLARAGCVLVSGLADGLDSEAHKAALAAGTATIGILGTAIDKTYPASHSRLRSQMEEQGGAVVSEYGPGTMAVKSFFLLRNRLIAAISHALCVVEARTQSGTMSTVHRAWEYGVPVYAVPGNVFSPLSAGTNQLIAEGGAKVLRSAQVLLQDLGLEEQPAALPVRRPLPTLSATAKRLVDILGDKPIGLEALCAVSDLPVGQVLAAITELELSGQVETAPGRQYTLSPASALRFRKG